MVEIHPSRAKPVASALAILATLALMSGCANLSAVRSFADETKKLSAAFDPMLAGSTASCTDKYKRKKLLTSRNFDPAAAEAAAAELCGPIDENNQVIAALNDLLEQYADTLAALADDRLPSYKAELDGLAAALGQVKRQGSQESLIPPAKLSAVAALTAFLGRAATEHLQRGAIRDLLHHEAAIMTVTDALKDYATLNYLAWLRDERRENEVLRKSLDLSAATEPLAANYLKTLLLSEERQIAARENTVRAFVQSVAQLQALNAEIGRKFDHLEDKELLAQLARFSNAVFKLRKQVRNAF